VELELTNGVGDEGARALASSRGLRRLQNLELAYNGIGDEGARALAEGAGNLPSLRELSLMGNEIGDPGALALARSPYLDRLRWLSLMDNDSVGRDSREALRRRFGDRVKF
jgi:hypothetical protein